MAVEDVDGFGADAPEIASEGEFFFEAEIEAGVGGKAGGVGRADELLLKIDDAEGIAGAVFEEIAELDAPNVGGRPAPGDDAVGGVPDDRAGLLGDVENGAERGIEDFIGMGDGAGVSAVELHAFGKNVAEGDGGGAVAVFAGVFEEKSAAGLRGLLIDISETVITIANEKLQAEERAVGKFLLPAGARSGEARLLETIGGENELADDGTGREDVTGGIVEGVDLFLVERLADEREI